MKNIVVVSPSEMDVFFDSFWKTSEFKAMQRTSLFFFNFVNKLKKSPMFFFDLTNENGKYHLSSHIRFIANREYENDYLRDLYYFHEMLHCAEFEPSDNQNYEHWKTKLNNNELYASVVSEALVYYIAPEMIGKTFNPLWVKDFYEKDVLKAKANNVSAGRYGFFEQQENFNPMSFDNIQDWPESVQNIYNRRNELRLIKDEDSLSNEAEKYIVRYNSVRERWIEKWKPHYLKIDSLLNALHERQITTQEYLDEVLKNCDASGRAFFPK